VTAWRIPLSDVDLGAEEREALVAVIDSGWLTLGAEVRAFEREFAEFCGTEEAVGVSSGTAALHLACLALGLGQGDEVVVPSLTFVACANAVALTGARPVFADVCGQDDLTIDPADVARRVTERTRAVMCVHYGGFACRMDELLALCDERGLALIEDVAHAPGGDWEGRRLGTIADVGCFSFFGNKNMTTGEGGMLLARDGELASRARLMRSHGMTTMSWDRFSGHAWDYDVIGPGYNYRPTELAAALGRTQLRKLERNNARRLQLLDAYRERLADFPGIAMPFDGRRGTAHLAVALVEQTSLRDPLRRQLADEGIQTSLHYPPSHLFAHYREAYGHAEGDLPVTEDAAARLVTLPLYPVLSAMDLDAVCSAIASYLCERSAVEQ
jgi:dTDP-4-amino-4,6-dideoxygalactose transaminase